MREEIISEISDGFIVDGLRVYARNISSCKLKGALSLDVYLKDRSEDRHLLCLTAYSGRMPYYRPWVELFCINNSSRISPAFEYLDSQVEDRLLASLSRALGPGGKIFIEYYSDKETSRCLASGYPPAITRQGFKLFNLGFTWFKDWYFSEGGHEGGQKLQGELPLTEDAGRLQVARIRREIESFLEASFCQPSGQDGKYHQEAVRRADRILQA